jgi:hypothetical protein
VRVLAGVIVAMSLVIGVVPQFTNCEARGGTMPSTTTAPAGGSATGTTTGAVSATHTIMKCLWTARAEIGVAVPLFAIGALMLLTRRRETRRVLAIPAGLLGLIAMLLPTVLIGVCSSPGAICRMALRPSMLIAGGLTVAASLTIALVNELRPDAPAQPRAAG